METIKRFGLPVIEDIQDLGYFGWKPHGAYKRMHQVTAEELKKGTNFQQKPHLVQPIESLQSKCPTSFKTKRTKTSRNEYPYNPSYLVPLYVAVANRGVNINSIDFIFGGSVLHVLASGKIQNNVEYWAQKIPGTDVVSVEKKQSYSNNWNDFGHLFERFVLEQYNNAEETVVHLQIMTLGGRRVLFAAEVDGMDQEESPVEIKSSNPKNWGIKVALQMVSNGSQSLYAGMQKNNKLQRIDQLSLSSVLQKAFPSQNKREEANTNIGKGIEALAKASTRFETPHTFHFEGGQKEKQLTFHPVSSFPSKEETVNLLTESKSSPDPNSSLADRVSVARISDDSLGNRVREGRLSERDHAMLSSMPDECAIGYGYVPDDFIGFD